MVLSNKKFAIGAIAIFFVCLTLIATVTYAVDPYFHFHEPIGSLYHIENQRYQNDGITRNFSYDALIAGTSMTRGFLTSQMDELFETSAIRISFNGASYREVNEAVERALSYNSNVSLVIRGLDTNKLCSDYMNIPESSCPEYLYDDNIWNDVNYLLNKDTLICDILENSFYILKGENITTFDASSYATSRNEEAGTQIAMSAYERPEQIEGTLEVLSEEDKDLIYNNIFYNVLEVAIENPDVEFYYFYTPYSVLYYDELVQTNQLNREFEILEYATSLIVAQDNITLFNFIELYDVASDLDNYKDAGHYSGEVSDLMMELMYEGLYTLTTENYQEKMEEIKEFYVNFDYDGIFDDATS